MGFIQYSPFTKQPSYIRMIFHVFVFAVAVAGVRGSDSRQVLRTGTEGTVNLLELNFGGTLYGKCSFTHQGEDIEVLFEDKDGQMVAKAMNPTVLDPLSKAQICREEASKPQQSAPAFRSALESDETEDSPMALETRFRALESNLRSNQEYLSQLRPRFGFMLRGLAFGIGLGKRPSLGSLFSISAHPSKVQDNIGPFGFHPFGFKG